MRIDTPDWRISMTLPFHVKGRQGWGEGTIKFKSYYENDSYYVMKGATTDTIISQVWQGHKAKTFKMGGKFYYGFYGAIFDEESNPLLFLDDNTLYYSKLDKKWLVMIKNKLIKNNEYIVKEVEHVHPYCFVHTKIPNFRGLGERKEWIASLVKTYNDRWEMFQ